MPGLEAKDQYSRLFNERYEKLMAAFRVYFMVLTSNGQQSKDARLNELIVAADQLDELLPVSDKPTWLIEARNKLVAVRNSLLHTPEFVQTIILDLMRLYRLADIHQWALGNSGSAAIDFDAIAVRYLKESRLSELFEIMVRKLQAIVDSGMVDSTRFLAALRKLIATIERNKNGTLLGTTKALEFTKRFIGKAIWKNLEGVPIVGKTIEAFHETLNEANEEYHRVVGQIQAEYESATEVDMPMPQLGSTSMLALGAPNDVIDVEFDGTTNSTPKTPLP